MTAEVPGARERKVERCGEAGQTGQREATDSPGVVCPWMTGECKDQ